MSPPRVTVAGGGLGARHLTAETTAALAECQVVFHLLGDQELVDALSALCDRVVSLVPLYEEGMLDLLIYDRIVDVVLDEAERSGEVGLVVVGHPNLYAAPPHLLAERGPGRGVEVRILPALSSIDAMLCELPFDIASTGLQILDANRLVTYGLTPSTQVPMLLFQVGCFGSGFVTRMRQNAPDRLAPLVQYLGLFYPPNHPATVLESQMGPGHRAVQLTMPIEALAVAGEAVTYNSTLFVPASQPFTVVNPAFLQTLVDNRAVGRLVR